MTPSTSPVDTEWYLTRLAGPVAESLTRSFKREARLSADKALLKSVFRDLAKPEKQFWLDYSAGIPRKFNSLGLQLRPYSGFCRTPIITEEEMAALALEDLQKFGGQPVTDGKRQFFLTLNFLVPASLKEAGIEIVREEEAEIVSISTAGKIARAIHAGYLREVARQGSPVSGLKGKNLSEFDDLPEEIKESNLSNAVHIPVRLLSVGYRIRPVRKGYRARALHFSDAEVETMARVEHLRWSWEKRLNGWTYGSVKDERTKRHPSLVPYEELTEDEKEKDRGLVRLVPAILQDIKYEAYPVSSDHTERLPYAIKPLSSIHKLLLDTNDLSAGISLLAGNSPEIMEKLKSIDEKIRLTISEVEGSYTYARHIQEAYLPGDLAIRECFTDSFVLFQPRDIVSGDFYLFSRKEGKVTFGLADCTGHGIPAALISTIGYGILDQAVNILQITDPSEALGHLYSGIHRFLRKDDRESGIADDMTIVLCSYDPDTRRLTFSGAGNAIFHVTGDKISENLTGRLTETQFSEGSYGFTTRGIQLEENDVLYVCSDGFADQFGGESHRRYSWSRLREYLLEISRHPMPEQGDLLYEEFERWRGEKDEGQTDDITVIGIRI
ncbi:MAG: SpoIIE family protein phosphatase [Bacteroidales bacterium]|nr:SpoIIE family protein phosphatase [Bacteroidales bacterium]